MNTYRAHLPQLDGGLFLTDAGLETDLIFNHGIDIPAFAAHTLLAGDEGREALRRYFSAFLELARERRTGFILDSQTWKAHRHWAAELGDTPAGLARANRESIAFIDELREPWLGRVEPILLNAVVGPRGDAYAPEALIGSDQAQTYHAEQMRWLAQTPIDMVTAMTVTQSTEAVGIVKAAAAEGLPVVISFTVETDGALPTGQPLDEAIRYVDWATDEGAAYFMINCAHPEHFENRLDSGDWSRRIRGIRCNASRCSHAELDACTTLDAGNPEALARSYRRLVERMPWINVVGGCCGSDLRHVRAIVDQLLA